MAGSADNLSTSKHNTNPRELPLNQAGTRSTPSPSSLRNLRIPSAHVLLHSQQTINGSIAAHSSARHGLFPTYISEEFVLEASLIDEIEAAINWQSKRSGQLPDRPFARYRPSLGATQEVEDEDSHTPEPAPQQGLIDATLRPPFAGNASSDVATALNISHGSLGVAEFKKRYGPLPPTPSTTSLATLTTVATGGTATPARLSVASTAFSVAPSTTSSSSSAYADMYGSPAIPLPSSRMPMTKRHYALHELLYSERSYASDLALVREVHIPLALGHSIFRAFSSASTGISNSETPALTSGNGSSGYPGSVISSASDCSGSESAGPKTPEHAPLPMTPDDVRIIFSNLEDIAVFSDQLCGLLEQALGSALSLSTGEPEEQQEECPENYIGRLFLEIIPEMEKHYNHYIHKQPIGLRRLHTLTSRSSLGATSSNSASSSTVSRSSNSSSTSSLSIYLQTTSSIAAQHSHTSDLPSLLVKPVQRFIQYPQLLQAILDETEDSHCDRESLELAKGRVEGSVRAAFESRRRVEVVREVLMGKGSLVGGLELGAKSRRMKNLRVGLLKKTSGSTATGDGPQLAPTPLPSSASLAADARNATWARDEERQVERMKEELKRIEEFSQTFARNVLDWAKMIGNMTRALRHWSLAFGRVIGLKMTQVKPRTTASGGSGSISAASPVFDNMVSSVNAGGSQGEGGSSEAFDAYLEVIEAQLMPLCWKLETQVNDKVLKDIARLLATVRQPRKLFASMESHAPFHQHLLTMKIGPKSRPSPALLAASQNYLALRGQLAAELPTYIKLLHTGLGAGILNLAKVQRDFWKELKEEWSHLWETLRVEGEMNARSGDTVQVWAGKWVDVDVVLASLGISEPPAPSSNPSSKRNTQEPPPKERKHSNASSNADASLGGAHVGISISSFALLMGNYESEPLYPPTYAQRIMAAQQRYSSYAHEDGWAAKNSIYVCRVVHACEPPNVVSYWGYPFFTLLEGDLLEVLQEAGHPSEHPKCPLYVDDGDDCLLMCRDRYRNIGWALASFLMPVELETKF